MRALIHYFDSLLLLLLLSVMAQLFKVIWSALQRLDSGVSSFRQC
jgi:hypothetical protein